LQPERTDTNIRHYSSKSLLKLLNIALLNKYGYKISKIAELSDEEIISLSQSLVDDNAFKDHAINEFKVAMFNFDRFHFQKTYTSLRNTSDFETVFNNFFIPFMNELGLLWQTNTISPAHEHFISSLIKQKVLLEIEKIQYDKFLINDNCFILFLPDQEIHDLGLTYAHYLLLSKGYNSIYLGQSIPVENLSELKELYDKITFLSYFTVKPTTDKIEPYINSLHEKIISLCNCSLWLMGRKSIEMGDVTLPAKTKVFLNINEFTEELDLNSKQKTEAS
jgi:methanogenic corrinoid protein MtbC1